MKGGRTARNTRGGLAGLGLVFFGKVEIQSFQIQVISKTDPAKINVTLHV